MESDTGIMSISAYINQLLRKEIGFLDIPEEYRLNSDIVSIERKLGIRTSGKRGFDIIRNHFFVIETVVIKNSCNEIVEKELETLFYDFRSYYKFLNGDIYEGACYYQYKFTQEELSIYNIDLTKINVSGLIDFTITSIIAESSQNDLLRYQEAEAEKSTRKKWIAKFNKCKTYKQFQEVIKQFSAAGLSELDLDFYIYKFIFSDKEKAFNIIMQYLSEGNYGCLVESMCIIYDPQKVIQAYDYNCGTKQANYKRKKKLRDFVKQLEQGDIDYKNCSCFEEKTHYYRYQVSGYTGKDQKYRLVGYPIYFDTFKELTDFLGNDLSNCDLSKAVLPDVDFSIYKTNEKTILPVQNQKDLMHKVYKRYDRSSGYFLFQEGWIDKNGNIVKLCKQYKFKYFFDFIYFLENDLSNADLLFCDGLLNMHDFYGLNLKDAKLHSKLLDRLDVPYQLNTLDTTMIESFDIVAKNEDKTVTALEYVRETYTDKEDSIEYQRIYYISDLHLLHTLNGKCKTTEDIIYELQKKIDTMLADIQHRFCKKDMLLIGGDTSSDFQIFVQFIKLLRCSIDNLPVDIQVIFLLGNHELWGFADKNLDDIIRKYEEVLREQKMYLLQNNILFRDNDSHIHKLNADELREKGKAYIRERLKSARIILFGGIAFSGNNKKFNANNGIYRDTISRKQEIEESTKFNNLYKIICNTLPDRNVIVFTHMPQKDWCSVDYQQYGFIYVNGHTHRNFFYDDGEYRNYADNQIGYREKAPHLKYFYIDDKYDIFLDYSDGIYSITKEQYIDFHRGKNIRMDFNRDINLLYMLKKKGYYCFLHQSKNGNFTILNGGVKKSLDVPDINYYYDRMDDVISHIRTPLDEYTSIQRQIANIVQKIGGSGKIHGAIVDIDFLNHIYVNPINGSITGYFATDMIDKEVFPSVQKLIEVNCPSLYANYVKMISGDAKFELAILDSDALSITTQMYLDTDIYKASREIKKMQKLNSNILSIWYDPRRPMIE